LPIEKLKKDVSDRVALPVDRHLQTPLGSGLDQIVDSFLDLLLDVVHDRFPSRWWIVGRRLLDIVEQGL
jgi:hypothetical protein